MKKIQENVELASMTTLAVGGPARYFLQAETVADVLDGLAFASREQVGVFILGGGSNLLVSDSGIDALVIRVGIRGVTFAPERDGIVEVTAGAGEDWDTLVRLSVERGFAGLECLSGIPGLVGGTPVQNVGAYGQEVAETITDVRCVDRSTGLLISLSKLDCGFSYRASVFNNVAAGRYIVVGVTYALKPSDSGKVVYKDLIEHFNGRRPTVHDVREAVLRIRRSKSMVIDAADPNSRSAGSFFKNPVVEISEFETLKSKFGSIPSFPFQGKAKIPAAWLIENAGFRRGFVMGNAGLSEKHTLALINRGNASARELIALKDRIQSEVLEKFGIELIPEPVFAGF